MISTTEQPPSRVSPLRGAEPHEPSSPGAARQARSGGFTFLEAVISLTIFSVLVASLVSLAVQSSGFSGLTDTDFATQVAANRTLNRLTEILRKTGRTPDGYPRVLVDGNRIDFKILSDLDGNGFPFDDATGDLEWDSRVFSIYTDIDDELWVWEGPVARYPLGRYVYDLDFTTVDEDPSLEKNEIRVVFESRQPTADGFDIIYTYDASIHMRN